MHSESGDIDGDDDELMWERWDDSDKDSAAKFFGKFIPETRWGMAERAVVNFSKRNKNVDKQGWQHQRNECCEVVEER